MPVMCVRMAAPQARDTKQDCRQEEYLNNVDCRQDKRQFKQDVREEARDIRRR